MIVAILLMLRSGFGFFRCVFCCVADLLLSHAGRKVFDGHLDLSYRVLLLVDFPLVGVIYDEFDLASIWCEARGAGEKDSRTDAEHGRNTHGTRAKLYAWNMQESCIGEIQSSAIVSREG
jgi:hypothetical protein